MSLAIRLVLALVAVAAIPTAAVGMWVRAALHESLERQFQTRIEAAVAGVEHSLAWEVARLSAQMEPLCQHGSFVDRAHIALLGVGGDIKRLEPGTRIALRHQVPDEAKAQGLDELVLIHSDGTVLAASDLGLIGTRSDALAAVIASDADRSPHLETGEAPQLTAHCIRSAEGVSLGLIGGRAIEPMLDRVGKASGVELSVVNERAPQPATTREQSVRTVDVEGVDGLRVAATLSREPLLGALEELDRGLLLAGGAAVLIAAILAIAIARSLSRPITALAHETREVVLGEPRPVKGTGGREIRELAAAFNHTIDELVNMRRRLAASERIAARREVARQVAHEIKNPLAPIRAAIETLRRLRARDDPAFDDYFDEASETVLAEVRRISEIVTEFTKFARMPAPKPAPMDLVGTARAVVNLHDRSIEITGQPSRARVELRTESGALEIRADKDQIAAVLTNLVQNGIDAATEARPDPRVVVSLNRDEGQERVRIVVRDNGPGVPDEFVPKLFTPYATTKAHGTGLGLAIVQRIIFEHGGEIDYRTASKGGAVFTIQLPVAGPTLIERSDAPTHHDGEPPAEHG